MAPISLAVLVRTVAGKLINIPLASLRRKLVDHNLFDFHEKSLQELGFKSEFVTRGNFMLPPAIHGPTGPNWSKILKICKFCSGPRFNNLFWSWCGPIQSFKLFAKPVRVWNLCILLWVGPRSLKINIFRPSVLENIWHRSHLVRFLDLFSPGPRFLRAVLTKVILFLKPMSGRGGSDIQWLWIWMMNL